MVSFKSNIYYYMTQRALAKQRKQKLALPDLRVAREKRADRTFKIAAGIRSVSCNIAGIECEWERPIDSDKSNGGIVLYLHGGAYITGSIVTHRSIASHLAIASNSNALVINYRLAPEHPFPAGLEDALSVYESLLQEHPDTPIALAGDSAGAGLVIALALKIREKKIIAPVALALMSPWTDLTISNPSHHTKASVDPYFPDTAILTAAAKAYSGQASLSHPLISPQFADLAGLPPTLIHVGEREALLDDSVLFAQHLAAQGGQVTIKQYPSMWHVWQSFTGKFREATESIHDMGAFLDKRLHDRS